MRQRQRTSDAYSNSHTNKKNGFPKNDLDNVRSAGVLPNHRSWA